MRGFDSKQDRMYSIGTLEERVPSDHPLRPIRSIVKSVLREFDPDFVRLYSAFGRPFIRLGRLVRAQLL